MEDRFAGDPQRDDRQVAPDEAVPAEAIADADRLEDDRPERQDAPGAPSHGALRADDDNVPSGTTDSGAARGAVLGGAAGAITGGALAGPPGAIVGGAIGAVGGGATGDAADHDARVQPRDGV